MQSLNCALNESRIKVREQQILALTETCATKSVLEKASKMAAMQACHTVHSPAVANKFFKSGPRMGRESEARGKSAGVWIASQNHVRQVHQPWPKEVRDMSRVGDAKIYTDEGPFYLACIYGLHQGLADSKAQTEMIIKTVFHRSELLQLPAPIVGDLKNALDDLVTWPIMVQRGWCDSAMLHLQKTGVQPVPTHKESTRIDFILMNNKASHAFEGYYASDLPVSDHRQIFCGI